LIDIRLGDCVDRTREIAESSIDLILSSPPYDKMRRYASGSDFDFEALAAQCKRVLKPGGVLVWVVGDETVNGGETGTSFRQSLHFQEIGLRRHDTMIWEKANPIQCGARSRYIPAFEFMFVHSKGQPMTVNRLTEACRSPGRRISGWTRRSGVPVKHSGHGDLVCEEKPRSNIWRYAVGSNSYPGHPAVFPLQLAIDHILSWTNPGDLVLDPFVGSGTTLEACLQADRNGIGIDKDPAYCEIAERRLRSAMLPLFGAT
jgi:DNA modification methylase